MSWLNTLYLISTPLNLLGFILWPMIWSTLVYVPRSLKKKLYSAVLGWGVQQMSTASCWLTILLSASISTLIFYFAILPIVEREVLKPITKIVDLSISTFSFISLLHIFCSSVVWCIHIEGCFIFLVDGLFIIIQSLSLVIFSAVKSI